MIGKPGDRIFLESETVGQPAREGEILEVITSPEGGHIRYRVRWQDGHESIITPAVGSARVVPAGGAEVSERETV